MILQGGDFENKQTTKQLFEQEYNRLAKVFLGKNILRFECAALFQN